MAMSSSFLITPARQCAVLEAGLLSMPRTSLKYAGTAGSRLQVQVLSLPLLQVHSEEEGCLFADHRLRAASKEGVYFNVALEVKPGREVVKWYQTPWQYVDLIPVDNQYDSPSAFFIATPPLQGTVLEFLMPNTVANELVNSKPGDRVVITTHTWLYYEWHRSRLMFALGTQIQEMVPTKTVVLMVASIVQQQVSLAQPTGIDVVFNFAEIVSSNTTQI